MMGRIVLFLTIIFMAVPAWAQISLKARYFGQIIPGASGVTLLIGDSIALVQQANMAITEGTGSLADTSGNYSVAVTKPTNFGNPNLTFLYKQGGNVYQLTTDGTTPISFPFFGTPSETVAQFNMEIGPFLFSSQPDPATAAAGGVLVTGENAEFDVDGDGLFGQKDVDAIKEAVSKGTPSAKFDVNKDGLTTTQDAIDAIKRFEKNKFKNRIQGQ